MFLVYLGSALALMHLYIWKRMARDTTRPGRARWALTGVVLALALLLVATLMLPRFLDVPEPTWLAWPGYLWFGVVVYLVLALLVLEPVRLALRRWVKRAPEPEPDAAVMDRRLFLARASAAAAGVTALGVTGVGAHTALSAPRMLTVPVSLRRLGPELSGYRIAVVSDIHLGTLLGRSHTERIVRMINEAQPDLVAIVGDLVDGTVAELGAAAEPLQDLVSRDGSFFVTGNHEYFVEDPPSWIRELDRLGVHSLQNESTRISRGGAAFDLAGVNDIGGARFGDPPDFDRALAATDPSGPTVLLAHQPVMIDEAAAHGVDLQVSGHTHGGQMWPFHYAVRAVQPSLAGLTTHDETQLYVTRGAGFWGPPVRIGAPPDITILTLQE
jgi:predicted MPP superfamily phosphohydrolase